MRASSGKPRRRGGGTHSDPPGFGEGAREQLARVLASPDFDASERNRRFLKYVVEETLSGRADRIKAYSIAKAVFDRDDGFDPQSDPIVRIEASRVRRSLERYYLLAGKSDPIRLEIPKGGYVPVFRPLSRPRTERPDDRSPEVESPPHQPDGQAPKRSHADLLSTISTRLRAAAAHPGPSTVALLLLSVLVLGGLALNRDGPPAGTPPRADAAVGDRPSLMVAAFTDLSHQPKDFVAEGLAQEILSRLIPFKEFVVFDARASIEPSGGNPFELGERLGADYIVTGSVRRDAGRIRVNAQLAELETGASIWTASYNEELVVDRLFEIQDRIAASVAAAIAQPYGVVYRDVRDRLKRQPPVSLSAYECLLQSYAYRRDIHPDAHAAVRSCLEEAVILEPNYADALAMLAMIYVDEFRWRFNPRPAGDDALDKALRRAEQAVNSSPDNASAWLAMFETQFFRGAVEAAFAAGDRAITLNPSNPEIKALVGLRVAQSGQWDRGIALVEEALALNPAPPPWYYYALSSNFYWRGEDEKALYWAKKIDLPGLFWTHVHSAAIYGQLGRHDDAARAVARLLEVYPDFEQRALIEFDRQQLQPAFLARWLDGLRKAGLDIPEPSAEDRRS